MTGSLKLLTTFPTATSNLESGLATYGFLFGVVLVWKFLGTVPNDCRGARAQVEREGVETIDRVETSEKVGEATLLGFSEDLVAGDMGLLNGELSFDCAEARLIVR